MHVGRRLRRPGPLLADTAIAVSMVVISCMVGAQYYPRPWGTDPVPYLLTVLLFLPMAVRRRVPVAVLVSACFWLAVYLALGYDQMALNYWAPVLALYSVAAQRPPRVTGLCMALVIPVGFWSAMDAGLPVVIAIAQVPGILAIAWSFGNVGRQLGIRNRQLAEATEQLRLEQELRTEQAVTQERLRIARELHDVVAHHMSVISMQAGLAGYVFDSDPPTARTAVETIGSTSRETLEEMRHLLNLLRASDAEWTAGDPDGGPTPGLSQLPALIERVRAAGIEVELTVSGALDTLPSGQQLTVYRIIQEALTNVIKHAGQHRATVHIRRHSRELKASIVNDGPITRASPANLTDSGHGLIGMRERARLYGGTVTAKPGPGGGFAVELTMPTP